MPNYSTPGVYVEEVPSKSQPISDVGTSTAGFIGKVEDGVKRPVIAGKQPIDPKNPADNEMYPLAEKDKPQLITNWAEFEKKFGYIQQGNRVLANAVFGFFNNGGTRCWVARVTEELNKENVGKVLISFEAIDEISIVAVPLPAPTPPAPPTSTQPQGTGDRSNLYNEIREVVLSHCEKMQDRFAILDGEDVTGDLKSEQIYSGRNSDYGAVYFPYIKVSSKVLKAGTVNEYQEEIIDMPPSGYIAGIYARVDANRGIFKAPANEVIRGVLKEKLPVSRIDQGNLNDKGINVIRQINGNVTVWGARTISDKPEYKYINVRRTLLFLRESIDQGTQWAVFEPNTPALWQKIKRNVFDFLLVQWRAGALFGNTKEEAFYVKCDAETNPPTEVALGRVIAEVGVSIVRPAEFVIFRISQTTLPS